jgi:hypothetical protein
MRGGQRSRKSEIRDAIAKPAAKRHEKHKDKKDMAFFAPGHPAVLKSSLSKPEIETNSNLFELLKT